MTITPRDDIGLSERLREEAARLSYRSLNHGCATCGVATNLADEAATQLDALSAELDDYKRVAIDRLDKLTKAEARVKELEREVEAFHRHEQTLRDNGIASHTDAVVRVIDAESRATRAEQERDEAYERAAKVAEGPIFKEKYRGGPGHNWFHIKQPGIDHDYGNGRLDAAAAIRRLSAGDEKEKK